MRSNFPISNENSPLLESSLVCEQEQKQNKIEKPIKNVTQFWIQVLANKLDM
jgi:hypothetical protein